MTNIANISNMNDIVLECKSISHSFGNKKVLHEISFRIIRGEIVALVGPSGCGKSTLLKAMIGTHLPKKGQTIICSNGKSIAVTAPGRDRGIVYQEYSLPPFLRAQESIALGLKLSETNIPFRFFMFPKWWKMKKEHMRKSAELLEKLGLKDAMRLFPHQMSGGMRQRVAVAQALIMKPEILLLDEPFGALDEATREEMQRMLLSLYNENCEAIKRNEKPKYTMLIVTHELNEAIYVGDRVLGLSQYWNWKREGHAQCPGATIVYDKVAPVFLPDAEREFDKFARQRREIRDIVFEQSLTDNCRQYLQFWEQIKDGEGKGVLDNGNV